MAVADLTTAESLIVQILSLAVIEGKKAWTFSRTRWIMPQLDDLAERGLLTWRWDNEANFYVEPTAALLSHPEFRQVQEATHP